MKKNVAIPVSEIRKSAARKSEIERLSNIVSVPSQDKQSQLQTIDDAIKALVSDSTNKKKALRDKYTAITADPNNTKTAKELKKAHDLEYGQLLKGQDDLVLPLQRERAEVLALVTDDEKATQLANLNSEQVAAGSYGLKELTLEEVAQRNADEHANDEYIRTTKYKDERAAAYPSIAEQLDALWKGGEEAEAMRANITAVKEKFPKPEDSNG